MGSLKRLVAASEYPITLVQAKQHLRVDSDDDDDIIEAYIEAATDSCERFLGRSLVAQTWSYYLDAFPSDGCRVQIPMAPLLELQGVFYRNGGSEETLSTDAYELVEGGDHDYPEIALPATGSWPSTTGSPSNAVRIQFRAGYVDPGNSPLGEIPGAIRAAVLLTIGALYAHRESVVVGQQGALLPWSAEQLLRQYRLHLSIA